MDIVGAADAFVGGFVAAICHGLSSAQALLWAEGASRLTRMVPGAQKGLPTREALLTLLAEHLPGARNLLAEGGGELNGGSEALYNGSEALSEGGGDDRVAVEASDGDGEASDGDGEASEFLGELSERSGLAAEAVEAPPPPSQRGKPELSPGPFLGQSPLHLSVLAGSPAVVFRALCRVHHRPAQLEASDAVSVESQGGAARGGATQGGAGRGGAAQARGVAEGTDTPLPSSSTAATEPSSGGGEPSKRPRSARPAAAGAPARSAELHFGVADALATGQLLEATDRFGASPLQRAAMCYAHVPQHGPYAEILLGLMLADSVARSLSPLRPRTDSQRRYRLPSHDEILHNLCRRAVPALKGEARGKTSAEVAALLMIAMLLQGSAQCVLLVRAYCQLALSREPGTDALRHAVFAIQLPNRSHTILTAAAQAGAHGLVNLVLSSASVDDAGGLDPQVRRVEASIPTLPAHVARASPAHVARASPAHVARARALALALALRSSRRTWRHSWRCGWPTARPRCTSPPTTRTLRRACSCSPSAPI